uniref:Uncharacterized protein n=1 Tax=Rhizophora mucronata TaxID=61149 RepID=A0A2P2JIB6_RHIMU
MWQINLTWFLQLGSILMNVRMLVQNVPVR